jgi:hypothetical protein
MRLQNVAAQHRFQTASPALHRPRAPEISGGGFLPRLARCGIAPVKIARRLLGDDEEIMIKRRRRFKQTTTLADRLAQEAGRLRERAKRLPPGTEQTELWRKVRQTETALRIDAWLSSPQSETPGAIVTLVDKRPRKRSAKSAHNAAP